MNERIDIYIKIADAWVYMEGVRTHRTLASAARHYSRIYGEPVRAKWGERLEIAKR